MVPEFWNPAYALRDNWQQFFVEKNKVTQVFSTHLHPNIQEPMDFEED